jgi:hypothetical protein
METIDQVQAMIEWHYGHTSHGQQLLSGLDTIQWSDPSYYAVYGKSYLPDVAGALCVFRGNEDITYVQPEHYWATEDGMNATRAVLRNNPQINVSAFAFCNQISSAPQDYVQDYLDSMSVLEAEFPEVTFVYFTGHAQSYGWAENRLTNNNMIRQHVINTNGVLYDFADIDIWWFNPDTQEWEMGIYVDYWGNEWPVQHPHYDPDEEMHTSWENCHNKGKATWWLMSRLVGWSADTTAVDIGSWGELKKMFR